MEIDVLQDLVACKFDVIFSWVTTIIGKSHRYTIPITRQQLVRLLEYVQHHWFNIAYLVYIHFTYLLMFLMNGNVFLVYWWTSCMPTHQKFCSYTTIISG